MQKYAVIAAGGSGARMSTDTPKQFLLLAGKPILMHSLQAFHRSDESIRIILVLPKDQINYWHQLAAQHRFTVAHSTVEGGAVRFHSVQKGLAEVPENSLIAVHDGVRPLIKPETITKAYRAAREKGNAVVSVKLKDSIRLLEGGRNKSVSRARYRLIQTPQVFRGSLLKAAFSRAPHSNFTDEASLVEHAGHSIHLIDGDYSNIKITTEADLLFAEALL